MKIGLVLDDTLDSTDGVQQYVLLLGGWLHKNGHEVHYLTGHTNRKDIKNLHSLSRNIRVKFNKNLLSVPLLASTKAIKKLLALQQFDILHIQMPYSPLLAGKIIKYAPKTTSIIGTFHIAPHGQIEIIGTRILRAIQMKNLKRVSQVISVSKTASQFALSTQKLESIVIPNAINLDNWRPTQSLKAIYDVVFVGRLVKRKGCIYLLKAIKNLSSQNKDNIKIRVTIVGDGPERFNLERFVENNNLSDICEFTGYVSEEKKKFILQRTKLAVFPSTGGESFGIVLLEAMSAGAIVLAGDNPGYRTVLGSMPSCLFAPKNSQQIANRVQHFLTNKNQARKLFFDQQKHIKQYDIDIVGSAIIKIYKKALKEL